MSAQKKFEEKKRKKLQRKKKEGAKSPSLFLKKPSCPCGITNSRSLTKWSECIHLLRLWCPKKRKIQTPRAYFLQHGAYFIVILTRERLRSRSVGDIKGFKSSDARRRSLQAIAWKALFAQKKLFKSSLEQEKWQSRVIRKATYIVVMSGGGIDAEG